MKKLLWKESTNRILLIKQSGDYYHVDKMNVIYFIHKQDYILYIRNNDTNLELSLYRIKRSDYIFMQSFFISDPI
jgi:hypothetical protein